MTENLKKFMELASAKDQNTIDRLNKADKEEIFAMAAEMGIELTDADFEQTEEEGEVSLEEVEAVAGGVTCKCYAAGGGSAVDGYNACGCVLVGYGEYTPDHYKCECCGYGEGYR